MDKQGVVEIKERADEMWMGDAERRVLLYKVAVCFLPPDKRSRKKPLKGGPLKNFGHVRFNLTYEYGSLCECLHQQTYTYKKNFRNSLGPLYSNLT